MKQNNNEWLSISDMMSGLMLVFMLIAVTYMLEVQADKDKIKEIALAYNKDKKELYRDLQKEFVKDLAPWGAVITKDNIVRFNAPEVLFESGSSEVSERFKNILDNFFPRYIKLLASPKYKEVLDEIRVEGHTTKQWQASTNQDEIYLNNMKLSQERASNVLAYCYTIDNFVIVDQKNWLELQFRANGMSYAKLLENEDMSRRVEFKVQMKTEEKIYQILEASQQ
jgi:outer membrane protein OmpA-like peptidoglycan-associated protein